LFLIKKIRNIEINIYIPAIIEISSIEDPKSIRIPNNAVPKAVEKTIKAVVMALIEPIYFTPYISAQVDEPKTLASPLEIPINPKKTKEKISELNKYKITVEKNNGIFVNNNNFLLVNLSIKNPEINKVITESIE
jgi:hypothetical protein